MRVPGLTVRHAERDKDGGKRKRATSFGREAMHAAHDINGLMRAL